MENLRSSNNKSGNRKWKFSIYTPILAGALFFMNPSWANAQNTSNPTRAKAEVSTSTILDRLNQKVWVSLPAEYNGKVLDFVLNDTIMRTRSATDYTEEFIVNKMKEDRWIDKQNQILFLWAKIYGWISQKKLYNRLDDENKDRSDEYKKSLKQIAASYEEYKKWFKTYMETRSAEYDKQSAEARQQSAEARKENMKTDSLWLKEIVKFYSNYQKNPDIVESEEIDKARDHAKWFIKDCKKFWIDYEDVMIKEVKTIYKLDDRDAREKVDEILQWIEGPKFADTWRKWRIHKVPGLDPESQTA